MEHDEQVALFQWAALEAGIHPELELMYAVPNGTRTTMGIARKMKAEGVKKGVPDICLPVSRRGFHGLYIEMKMPGNYPTPEQKGWLKALLEQGYLATDCHGWIEAKELIETYLKG